MQFHRRHRARRSIASLCICISSFISFSTVPTCVFGQTVQTRLEQFGAKARQRLAPDFQRLTIAYPPKAVTLVGLKAERRLEVWVSDGQSTKKLCHYDILAASGTAGPKLRQGDRQVPEGIYQLTELNPNSAYHVSMRLNYPNADDRKRGAKDGRTNLGGDIMIHGGAKSIGCLAVGNQAAEDLFTLAADVGVSQVRVLLSPMDLRAAWQARPKSKMPWVNWLYYDLRQELQKLSDQLPPTTNGILNTAQAL